jgi:hypothetical protein
VLPRAVPSAPPNPEMNRLPEMMGALASAMTAQAYATQAS